MPKLLPIVLLTALAGCQVHNEMSKAKQDYVCSNRGGVYEYGDLDLHSPEFSTVLCRDGAIIRWYTVVLPEEYWP